MGYCAPPNSRGPTDLSKQMHAIANVPLLARKRADRRA